MPEASAKELIGLYFREHIGEVVTGQQLKDVIGPDRTEWARRVRELRHEHGWPIETQHDDTQLKQGEYRLVDEPPSEGDYQFARSISRRLRAEVLERNGYTCRMCGAGAGEVDELDPSRKVRLHVGHIVDRSHGGRDELGNLRAQCSACNEGAKNLTQEPPSWTWLLGQIRRASVTDQQAALEWLQRKFGSSNFE